MHINTVDQIAQIKGNKTDPTKCFKRNINNYLYKQNQWEIYSSTKDNFCKSTINEYLLQYIF